MAGRSAKVTQAELERAIRATIAAGLPIICVAVRADGYAIETAPSLAPNVEDNAHKPKPVL